MFDFEYNDTIMSVLSVIMICYILYTVYNSYMNEQEIFPSPFDTISKMTGLGDDTEIIKHHIAPEDDTDSETENDVKHSSFDNLDSVLEQLPSQIKKNIDCSIEKHEESSTEQDNEEIDKSESDQDGSVHNESDQDDYVHNDSDDNDEDSNNSDQDDYVHNVECNKLDSNNKLRMRKVL